MTGPFAGPDEVLAPGFVFACDIQLFRLDEQIGIRIEDTVAITESGLREALARRAADGRRDRGPDEEGRDPPDSSRKAACELVWQEQRRT
ncbi:MAG: aminopeptidase P family protein [Candidatus Moduliflexus flocculans]|nr:aminopeptidase P family protein [Candidatus Moduliflexus flocculans]